jgi:hypothetical protein
MGVFTRGGSEAIGPEKKPFEPDQDNRSIDAKFRVWQLSGYACVGK